VSQSVVFAMQMFLSGANLYVTVVIGIMGNILAYGSGSSPFSAGIYNR
jgi:hypothetical protein